MGRIITPGANQLCDTCTAATPTPTVRMASAAPRRRFLVMNWRRARPRSRSAAARTVRSRKRGSGDTMFADCIVITRIRHVGSANRARPGAAGVTLAPRSPAAPLTCRPRTGAWGTNASMTGPYPIRPITEAEWAAYNAVSAQAFNNSAPPDEELDRERVVFEFDRSLA